MIVGNVGTLTGGMVLLPGAEPDDGQLDVALLTPVRAYHWVGLGAHRQVPCEQVAGAGG